MSKITKKGIYDELTDQSTPGKTIVLFDTTPQLKRVNGEVANDIRSDSTTSLSVGRKMNLGRNKMVVGDKIVFLGLKKDKKMLLNLYDEEQLKDYEE